LTICNAPCRHQVEDARIIAKKAVDASEKPENVEKLDAAAKELKEKAGGDHAKFGQLVPVVFQPVVIECLGDVFDEHNIPKDAGGVMQFSMAMMMHGADPEVAAAQVN
jgi:hypothetical protein